MSLTKTIDIAKRDAKTYGRTMLVLNLNRFSPLYVIREYTETLAFSDRVVAVVEPCGAVA
jgi:hypothetical protein